MKLTILGSGTMLPTKSRFPSAILLESKKTKILLDYGHGTLARLTEVGIDPRDIDLIFISHFHTDHFGDAFNLVHSRFVGDLYQKKENQKLIFWGPKTIKGRFQKWREIFWVEPNEDYPVKFFEGKGKYNIKDISFEVFDINHVRWFQSVGIKLRSDTGKIIAYPGDVGSGQDFGELVKNVYEADLLIIEPGFEKETFNHFTLGQTEQLVTMAKVKKTVFTHLRPLKEEEKRVRKFIKNNPKYLLAEDKMLLKI